MKSTQSGWENYVKDSYKWQADAVQYAVKSPIYGLNVQEPANIRSAQVHDPGNQQGSPFDNGFTALQTLFTGTVAKVASLIAIVIGGYQFAHGEPGGKKALAGVAAGTGIAVLAANVLTWLWGV